MLARCRGPCGRRAHRCLRTPPQSHLHRGLLFVFIYLYLLVIIVFSTTGNKHLNVNEFISTCLTGSVHTDTFYQILFEWQKHYLRSFQQSGSALIAKNSILFHGNLI